MAIWAWLNSTVRPFLQRQLVRLAPMVLRRWVALGVIAAFYAYRLHLAAKGFQVVSHGLFFMVSEYCMLRVTDTGVGPLLPVRNTDVFHPFIPYPRELILWYHMVITLVIASAITILKTFHVLFSWPKVLPWLILFSWIGRFEAYRYICYIRDWFFKRHTLRIKLPIRLPNGGFLYWYGYLSSIFRYQPPPRQITM